MSSDVRDDPQGPGGELTSRLGYVLKHVQEQMSGLNAAALAPLGISGRELAVLLVLDGRGPASQQQAAQRLGIDRTTMVALLDGLEHKGLVTRHPHEQDRRRNVVELTPAGEDTLRRGTEASADAERRFLAPLNPSAARQLRESLQTLLNS